MAKPFPEIEKDLRAKPENSSRARQGSPRAPLRSDPKVTLDADAHQGNAEEHIFGLQGRIEITVSADRYALEEGQSISFAAGTEHYYANPGEQMASSIMLISYLPYSLRWRLGAAQPASRGVQSPQSSSRCDCQSPHGQNASHLSFERLRVQQKRGAAP